MNSVTRWLDAIAERFPDKIGMVDEHKSYTFSEIRERAVSVANRLLQDIPDRKQPVVIYMDKSVDMLVAYFGVAYSGCFYCPIATDMPFSRAEKILSTVSPAAIIHAENAVSVPEWDEIRKSAKYVYDFGSISGNYTQDADDAVMAAQEKIVDSDLLYVLFTSGSTGVPKGVAINHRNVINYIEWAAETFAFTEADSFANQAPFYFDNSVLDIYSCIRNGATLFIVPGTLFMQPVKLLNYLEENKITTIYWVPSALMVVSKLDALHYVDLTGTLKRVIFAGEVMPNKHLNIWRRYLPEVVYANLYGPTESDVCTAYIVDREFSDDEPLPIGKGISNMEILVLSDEDKLCGVGENGELCIRAAGLLAAGYYNNPDKTAEVFVQNPLVNAYREIIYRTGDIVHLNEREELIYVCRKDFQIKHLGHRIELGEIENAVSSVEGVDNCCCAYDEKKSRIVLFVESKIPEVDQKYIHEKIADMVPDYMIPGKVIRMDRFPYNRNGKIDRVQLKQSIK